MWINHTIISSFVSIRRHLPKALASMIERMMPRDTLTKEQFSKIKLLGSNIGLEREEIIAAIDGPVPEQSISGRSRALLLVNLAFVTIIVVAAVLFIWTVVDPESSPIRTYAPGSFYGTIKPQDFAAV
ncbi:MAG: hypothetical protein ACFFEF_09860 [Candidatus Thorarchaeota archaeon]